MNRTHVAYIIFAAMLVVAGALSIVRRVSGHPSSAPLSASQSIVVR